MSADAGSRVDRDTLHRPCVPGAPDHVRERMAQCAARAADHDWDESDANTVPADTSECEAFERGIDASIIRRGGWQGNVGRRRSVFQTYLPRRGSGRVAACLPNRGRTRQRRRPPARRRGSRRTSAGRDGPGDPDGEADPPGLANLPWAAWGPAGAQDARARRCHEAARPARTEQVAAHICLGPA
jgi:hypothetical protein